MKATFSKSLQAGLLALFTIASLASFAQTKKDKKSTVRIRIEQDIDGKTKVHEKSFDATGLTDKQKENLIQEYQDSVMAKNKDNVRGTKVEVESFSGNEDRDYTREEDDHFSFDTERPRTRNFKHNDDEITIRDKPRVRVYRRDGGRNNDVMEDLNLDLNMEGLENDLNQMGRDLKFEFRALPDVFAFDGSAASKTIRGLDVYPNNPKTEVLNIRFSSQQKGDVSIKVLDLKGNVVAKEEIKDFTGEYVGQVNIGKQKGVVFVMVTQGEDGTVKRVSLPENKE